MSRTGEPQLAEQVEAILRDCLYNDDEISDHKPPKDALIIEGIIQKFGLHPDRVAKHKEDIRSFLNQMPDEFHIGRGGGWTFLNLCMTKDGVHWGEHRNVEQLVVLSIAAGLGRYTLPRDMWKAFPGEMPYISFDTREVKP